MVLSTLPLLQQQRASLQPSSQSAVQAIVAPKPEDASYVPGQMQNASTASQPFLQQISLPASARLSPVTAAQLPSLRHLISLLLPVRYPDRFYNTLVSNPEGNSISRTALWYPLSGSRTEGSPDDTHALVVGGICARVEMVMAEGTDPTPTGAKELYIQTLAVLSPYRGQGLASALLEDAIGEAVQSVGVSTVYAHVWEANEEALDWYKKRGFTAEEKVLEDYYRRLQPNGARFVWKRVGITDALKRAAGDRLSN